MSGNRGCLVNSVLFLVIVFLPIIGQIILTLMVFEDEHSLVSTVLWLVVIWLIPFLGPLLYLLVGQRNPRRGRIMFGQASSSFYPEVSQQNPLV